MLINVLNIVSMLLSFIKIFKIIKVWYLSWSYLKASVCWQGKVMLWGSTDTIVNRIAPSGEQFVPYLAICQAEGRSVLLHTVVSAKNNLRTLSTTHLMEKLIDIL